MGAVGVLWKVRQMKKLISSFLAEMRPLWLKQQRQNLIGRRAERPEQLEDIIRANPWVPFQKRKPMAPAGREAAHDVHTRH
jgi:hypothetical protein